MEDFGPPLTLEDVRRTARTLAQASYFDFEVEESNGVMSDLNAWSQRRFVVTPQVLANLSLAELEYMMALWIVMQRRHEIERQIPLKPWSLLGKDDSAWIFCFMLGIFMITPTLIVSSGFLLPGMVAWLVTVIGFAVWWGLRRGRSSHLQAIALVGSRVGADRYREKLTRFKLTNSGLKARNVLMRLLLRSVLSA